jgi:hypothetical protein
LLEITVTCNGETIKYLASGLPITIKQSELVTVVVNYAVEHSAHPTLLESADLQASSQPEHSATPQTDQNPQQRG